MEGYTGRIVMLSREDHALDRTQLTKKWGKAATLKSAEELDTCQDFLPFYSPRITVWG